MKRVLVLSYYYPPIGGSGGQRPLRLVQHLREFGYEPVVVTGPGAAVDRWAPSDADLARSLTDDVDVFRIPGVEPLTGGGRARAERVLGIKHPWTRWWADGVLEEGRKAVGTCDLIWAIMQPYGSAFPAAELSEETGVPWIADLADPWALDEMLVYPSALHRQIEMRRMRRALLRANGIVMSTSEAAQRLVGSFPDIASIPIAIGPHGWERSDFAASIPPRLDDAFRIVHTGYLHTELGIRQRKTATVRRFIGGGRDNAQIITRSHIFLIEAIDRLLAARPEFRRTIEVHLAGVVSETDKASVRGNETVRLLGYLDHQDSVALLRSADLLFLPMHDLPMGTRASIVPGKTYEYLASGRPILAAVPDGDARDILTEAGSAFTCRPRDVDGMRAILSDRVDARLAGQPDPIARAETVERFEYRALARDLSSFFDRVLSANEV